MRNVTSDFCVKSRSYLSFFSLSTRLVSASLSACINEMEPTFAYVVVPVFRPTVRFLHTFLCVAFDSLAGAALCQELLVVFHSFRRVDEQGRKKRTASYSAGRSSVTVTLARKGEMGLYPTVRLVLYCSPRKKVWHCDYPRASRVVSTASVLPLSTSRIVKRKTRSQNFPAPH